MGLPAPHCAVTLSWWRGWRPWGPSGNKGERPTNNRTKHGCKTVTWCYICKDVVTFFGLSEIKHIICFSEGESKRVSNISMQRRNAFTLCREVFCHYPISIPNHKGLGSYILQLEEFSKVSLPNLLRFDREILRAFKTHKVSNLLKPWNLKPFKP